jgi:ubiquinone/menaquinone biosynthesis C-methylase UbiE
MAERFEVEDYQHLLLPGLPADYMNTAVFDGQNRELLSRRDVMLSILRDRFPVPTTPAREGYFGDRHIEFWLSGYRDAQKVVNATGLDRKPAARILDFGGASGRVIRHFRTWCPDADLYLSDINPQHVRLARIMFGSAVHAFRNHGTPALPFPDDWLDCAVAFSVFTHIQADDTAWLLELRRIVKPSGHIYLTIHDNATWEALPNTYLSGSCLSNTEFKQYYDDHPTLQGRVTHFYNDASDYNCNVFIGRDYIEQHWAPLFSGYSTAPLAHDHQASLIFRVG